MHETVGMDTLGLVLLVGAKGDFERNSKGCFMLRMLPGLPGERRKIREQNAGSAALLPDFARRFCRAIFRVLPGFAGFCRAAGPQAKCVNSNYVPVRWF